VFEIRGGIHTDTTFTEIVPGTEEVYGPFEDYDHAVNVWRGKMGTNIDICEHRLFVVPVGKDDCERCLGERGGVPGNENIVDGVVLCDYCTADELFGSDQIIAPDPTGEISVCDKCGAEYPSAPLGTIHKCGRCSGGYCQRRVN
jgi:hypothetical protein